VSRVLVTGGTGAIGQAIVRRLLRDPDFEVRVSDQSEAPDWMREGASIHTGDLRDAGEARRAVHGCSHVIHVGTGHAFTSSEVDHAVIRAAIEEGVERFTYVSSSLVFENAEEFPTPEDHLPYCPPPRSAHGWAKLAGEWHCRAAHDEFGLPFAICRPFDADELPDLVANSLVALKPLPIHGSGEQTRTVTHVDDIADGIVVATAHPAGLNEDFNIAAREERTVAEIARICWEAAGNDPADLELVPNGDGGVQRQWPSVDKAERLLGWRARIGVSEGIEWLAAR
jgi:nucleoside-diphosphate-sugar epimerase